MAVQTVTTQNLTKELCLKILIIAIYNTFVFWDHMAVLNHFWTSKSSTLYMQGLVLNNDRCSQLKRHKKWISLHWTIFHSTLLDHIHGHIISYEIALLHFSITLRTLSPSCRQTLSLWTYRPMIYHNWAPMTTPLTGNINIYI